MAKSKIWRKLFHLCGGSFFPIFAFVLPKEVLLVLLTLVTILFLGLDIVRFAFLDLNHWLFRHLAPLFREREHSQLTGSTYLLLSSLATFLLFERDIAIVALLFLAVGDPLAALVGEQMGRGGVLDKSLEGSLAYFLSSLALGVALARLGLFLSVPMVFAGAAAAALMEVLPLPTNDNLTIPLVSAATMALVRAITT
ncbi:MAG: hypothetical protein M1136_00755 [Chloroflexi bacterium]|nr:hypothetical protein [Chloroflexota bacterium]